MTQIYALAIVLGAALTGGAVAGVLRSNGRAVSTRTRLAATGLLGFGLAGMSASFGGWSPGPAIAAALAGGAALAALGNRYAAPERVPGDKR